MNSRVAIGERNQFQKGVVGAAVVNANDLEARVRKPVENAANRFVESINASAFIAKRHDNGYKR